MSIYQSIFFRTKRFVQSEERKELLQRNNLHQSDLVDVSDSMIESLETVRNYVNKSTVLLDIGAHRGLFSKAANAFFKFDQTICFEPNEHQNKWIERNTSKFSCRIENVALSDKAGEVTFYLHEDETMNSIVEADDDVLKGEFPYDNPEKMRETKVGTTTLDKAVHALNFTDETFFLKIDTQGNELNVLNHATQVLKQTEVCFIEYMFLSPYKNNFSFQDLVGFMDSHQFDCQGALSILKRPSKKVSAVDFVFVKRTE